MLGNNSKPKEYNRATKSLDHLTCYSTDDHFQVPRPPKIKKLKKNLTVNNRTQHEFHIYIKLYCIAIFLCHFIHPGTKSDQWN